MRLLLVLGVLSLLLAFGCMQKQSGAGLGDADISPQQGSDDDLMPDEDLVPPEDSAVGSQVAASDITVEAGEDYDYISDEDVVEPV